ncbi:hypothetical protein LINPERPRIM_LOCUS5810, partial [Linum perenne]
RLQSGLVKDGEFQIPNFQISLELGSGVEARARLRLNLYLLKVLQAFIYR